MSERHCRICGCTDRRACVDRGLPCHWVLSDLCSACLVKGVFLGFPEKLRLARMRRNVSQGELGQALGVCRTYVNKIERGKRVAGKKLQARALELLAVIQTP